MNINHLHIFRTLFVVVGLLLCLSAGAQGEVKVDSVMDKAMSDTIHRADKPVLTAKDTLALLQLQKESKKIKRDWTTWKPNPKRAMWLAIVLPGAGQIYNRKYWKLPIFYGGFLGCAYAMRWNNQMYADYAQAYIDIMDDNPNTNSFNQFLHLGSQITNQNIDRYKELFRKRKDRFRRWRDLSFFCMIGVYGLSIIDAYVDASLSQFDISDDLSLRLEPGFVNSDGKAVGNRNKGGLGFSSNTGVGINAALTF